MDRLTVGQCHYAEDARRGFAGALDLAPEADTPIRLLFATERGSDDLGAPSRIGRLGRTRSSKHRVTDDKLVVRLQKQDGS